MPELSGPRTEFGEKRKGMTPRLTVPNWTRIAIATVLIGLSAFCVLQMVIAGIAYGDILDVPGRLTQAVDLQRRIHRYQWACIFLQGLTTLLLVPAVRSLRSSPNNSPPSREPLDYLLGLGISIIATGVAFLLTFFGSPQGFRA